MFCKRVVCRQHFLTSQSSYICTQFTDLKFRFLTQIILFIVNHLFAHKSFMHRYFCLCTVKLI